MTVLFSASDKHQDVIYTYHPQQAKSIEEMVLLLNTEEIIILNARTKYRTEETKGMTFGLLSIF